MIRAPSFLDDNTRTFARTCPGFGKTAAEMAAAIEVHKIPLHRRFVYALCRHGWVVVPAVLAVLVLSGCNDMHAEQATAASLRDALAQARADVAVGLVARGEQP